MKRTAIISLLLLLFVSQIGYHFIMEFIREEYKENLIKAILPKLKEEDLTEIDAGNKGINWLEEDREFMLGTKMYDVVKVKVEKGRTTLYCLADTDEEKIIAAHNELTKQTSSPSTEGKNGKHFPSVNTLPDFIITDNIFCNTPFIENHRKAYSNLRQTLFLSSSIEVNIPPPKA